MERQEPAQITITVFSARNLQSKRKGEVCLASVVFGVSKSYYMTETVESNNPEWNQEAKVNLPHKQHSGETVVKFKVRDKEHILGVATLNLHDLGRHRGHKQWLQLSPHKKSHEVHGEVHVECFISEFREKPSPHSSQPGSQEDLRTPKGVGIKKGRFSFHRRTNSGTKSHDSHSSSSRTPDLSPSPTIQDRRWTGSDAELHSNNPRIRRLSESGLRTQFSPERTTTKKFSADNLFSSTPSDPNRPEVTGISPRESPLTGSERVVLRGCNLGSSAAEVVRVVLAGVDCTETLEYISSSKLAVTTPLRLAPCSGPVLVETLSGGVGTSSLTFAFVGEKSFEPPEVTGISPREGSIEGNEKVVLRGSNLGECKSDVVKILIAGVDCTHTLEYLSPAKLVVTTPPCSLPTTGPVVVETVNGGVCDSGLTFAFVEKDTSSTSARESKGKIKQQGIDQAEIKALKQQVKDLKDDNAQLKEENQALKQYVDNLMLTIMDAKPDLLEVKSAPSTPITVSRTSIVQ